MHCWCDIVHGMDVAVSTLSAAIGARVRQERLSRQWTLDQLAAAAGVSRRLLVSVEQGDANPSVGSLLKLSDSLGVGLPALVEPPNARAIRVIRDGEGAELWSGQFGGRGLLVAGTGAPDVMELWDWLLAPGDRHDSEPHTAGTTEIIHVREGELLVEIGDDAVTLEMGDAVTFSGDVGHSYVNPGTQATRFVLAVSEPGVGVQLRTEKDR